MLLTYLPILLAQAALLVLSAFCSGSETTLFGLTYNDRLQLKRRSPLVGAAVDRLMARPRALLLTLLMANMTINVVYLALGSLLVLTMENEVLGGALNIASVVCLVAFGEVSPKLIAAAQRVRLCLIVARPVLVLFRVLGPVVRVIEEGVVAPLMRLFRPHAVPPSGLTVEELSALVDLGASQGTIARDEQRLLAQVVEFGTVRVREVMAPRMQIHWLDVAAGPAQVTELIKQTGVTHVPVFRGSPDQEILGILDARRYLGAVAAGRTPKVADSLQRVVYVPETARLDQLLHQFRRSHSEVLLCVDEYGTVDGLVRIGDIADRLVAKFSEEDAFAAEFEDLAEQGVSRVAPGRWTVPGRLGIRAWSELFGQAVDRPVSTVAGLVMARLGRLPRVGDEVDFSTVRVRVASMRGNVVERLEVSIKAEEEGREGQGGREGGREVRGAAT